MDSHSIKTKLIQTVNSLDPSETEVQVDWVGGPPRVVPLGATNPGRRPAAFRTAVAPPQRVVPPSPARIPTYPVAGPGASQQADRQRLRAMVEQINHLSLQQEQAIAEIQTLRLRLAQAQPSAAPTLDLHRAVVAAAAIDSQGTIALAYRPVTPARPPGTAGGQGRRLAPPPSGQRRSPAAHRPRWQALTTEALALVQEPSHLATALVTTLVTPLGRWVWGLTRCLSQWTLRTQAAPGAPFPPSGGQLPTPASLSLVDSIFWFGGGVIGRLALGLLVAAVPTLWSVAVAAITATMAYALYRATLAPKLAFGPLARVVLLAAGWVVGGQL